ncbi:type III PLP-dependent enzyme [Streptomyces zingiberis]|uniref:Type III PLP-dependent enzyme n=1 Tax=Streptomyces zingiberis TaxID=2053010 RepID=A0ABX1C188_9ACTN|nr:type III PLP-dependent enzyme [Streptomyces zingiberis]NJQ01717.1 type III PLP-dependent enzyme [Streptomyces zingiberis]
MRRGELLRHARRYGTPLYLYDLAEVRERAAELRAVLPPGARLLYSLKANPLPPVVGAARGAGCGAEVCSTGELEAALAAGYRPGAVLYGGPGKTRAEVDEAVARGVRTFSCESRHELPLLRAAAVARGRRLRLLLRLRPGDGPPCGLSMARGRPFGLSAREAAAICLDAGPADPWTVEGCHLYLGSQLPDADALLDGFARARAAVTALQRATGFTPRVVDLGGGFPWPYAAPGHGCDLTPLRAPLAALTAGWDPPPAPRVWFESGRRLMAACGTLLATVLDVKEVPGRPLLAVTDAGVHVLGGMTGLGRLLPPGAGPENLSAAPGSRPEVTADIAGPLCTPLDQLASRTRVARPDVGDVLSFPNVGAYGLTTGLTAFLSRPAPLQLVHDGGARPALWRLTTRTAPVAPGGGGEPDGADAPVAVEDGEAPSGARR